MHRRIVVPNRDRRPRVEDARKRVAARPDFFGVEHPRGRSLGAKSVRGVGEKEKLAITIRHLMLATILHHENSWRSSEFGLARTHGSFSPGILAAVCDGGEANGKAPRADLVPIAFPYLPAVSLPFALNCT